MDTIRQQYIHAVIELLHEGKSVDDVLEKLKSILHKKGYTRLYIGILKGVHQALIADETTQNPHVVVATKTDAKKLAQQIKEALSTIGTTDTYILEEDNTIIGGFIASFNHRLYDASYKSALKSLYRNITR